MGQDTVVVGFGDHRAHFDVGAGGGLSDHHGAHLLDEQLAKSLGDGLMDQHPAADTASTGASSGAALPAAAISAPASRLLKVIEPAFEESTLTNSDLERVLNSLMHGK